MHWLLGFYMWLFIHRPFEYYPALGDLQIERVYMLFMVLAWLVVPGKEFYFNRLHAALAAFTSALVICWLHSPWVEQCSDLVEMYAKTLVFYVLFVTSIRDSKGLRRMLAMYLIAVGLYMVHSLLEFLNGRIEYRMGISRMVGVDVTFRDPNSLASTLLLALVMSLPFWLQAKTLGQRLLLIAFCGTAFVCILFTGSRTGFVGLGVVSLFAVLVTRANKGVVLALGTAGVVGALALPGPLQDRFLTIIDPSRGPANAQTSAEGRIEGLLDGVDLFEKNMVFGVGPSAFPLATGKGFNPHNLYGQVLAELGTVGTLAFLGILWCFWRNWREMQRIYMRHAEWGHDFPWQVCRTTGLAVILLLFLGMAGHNLYRYVWVWVAGFQVVALHCARTRARSEEKPRRITQRVPAIINRSPRYRTALDPSV